MNQIPRKRMIIIVFSIILVQLLICTYFMAYKKHYYYADDIYSYGAANSYGKLNPLQDEKYNVWIDGNTLVDFLTVSREEAFSYKNLNKTMELDAHPPFYFVLLRTVCSFTPGVFSKWSGYVINAIGFIILQIFLYRLTLYISHERSIAILVMTFFGVTSATVNMMCFLRMYMLSTGFAVAFTFYCLKYVWESEEKIFNMNLFLAGLFLYLDAVTDYFSIIYAFFLALLLSSALLLKKKIKQALCFGISMLASVLLMFITFPVVFKQFRSDQPGLSGAKNYPYLLQLRTGIHVIMNSIFGISTPVYPSMIGYYCLWTICALTILYFILLFLFRKEAWFRKSIKNVLTKCRNIAKSSLPYVQTLFPIVAGCMIIVLIYSRFLLIYYYFYNSIRYFYLVTPFIAMTFLIFIFKGLRSDYIRMLCTVVLIGISLIFGNKSFLGNRNMSVDLLAETSGADVIVIEKKTDYFTYHIADIMECNEYLFSTPQTLKEDAAKEAISGKALESNNMVLILDINCDTMETSYVRTVNLKTKTEPNDHDNGVVEYIKQYLNFENVEYLGTLETCNVYKLK